MPRPKGSKNKKTLAKYADIEAQIAGLNASKTELEKEQDTILAAIADSQARLKSVKKDIRAFDRNIAKLEAKIAEAEAASKAEETKKVLQGRIEELVKSGVSMEELLEKLQ